jgi:ABC-type uncharacterized transport system auxiliary subunit
MRIAAALLLAAALAACAATGQRHAHLYYVLEAPRAGASAPHANLAVPATTAAAFYDTQDIVFSRASGVRAYYQFNHWTERPQRVVHAALVARLGSGASDAPYVLTTRLDEMYHDAAHPPGSSHIRLTAELVEREHGTLVARRTFRRSAPATSYDARGAVQAFAEALAPLADDVAQWTQQELPTGR